VVRVVHHGILVAMSGQPVRSDQVAKRAQAENKRHRPGVAGSNTPFDVSRPGNVWSDNRFDDGTVVDPSTDSYRLEPDIARNP
jgi:hypothetical protein